MLKRLYYCLVISLAISLTAPAFAGGPPDGNGKAYQLKYEVGRNGTPIGHYHFDIREQGNSYHFEARLDIEVSVLGFTVYGLEHKRSEHWRNDRLIALEGKSVYDDGKKYKISLHREGEARYHLRVNDSKQIIRDRVVSFSPRRPGNWDKARLITLKGEADAITKQKIGTTRITMNGTDYKATHYRMKGDVVRDLWYDASGRLLKLSYNRDGDTIAFLRTRITGAQ